MLSRVADSLYWMSRYLERAEHTARLVDVNLTQMLDQTPEAAEPRWERLLASLQAGVAAEQTGDAYRIAQALTFDAANPASIAACIAAARENARQVREQISSEMWEQLNRLYLRVRGASMDAVFNLVNAYEAIGLIEWTPRQRRHDPPPEDERKSGLLGKLGWPFGEKSS